MHTHTSTSPTHAARRTTRPVEPPPRERELFFADMADRLQAAGSSLERGRAHAARLDGHHRERFEDRLESLRHKRDSMETKLATAAHAGTSGFPAARYEVEEAWSDLRDQWTSVSREIDDDGRNHDHPSSS